MKLQNEPLICPPILQKKNVGLSCLPSYFSVQCFIQSALRMETTRFYTGLIVYASGSIPYVISTLNFASTLSNEPIVKGVYKISRNPMYFFSALALLGMGIVCAPWIMIMLAILYAAVNHLTVFAEEKYCSEKYSEYCCEYMKNVPRYFLFF